MTTLVGPHNRSFWTIDVYGVSRVGLSRGPRCAPVLERTASAACSAARYAARSAAHRGAGVRYRRSASLGWWSWLSTPHTAATSIRNGWGPAGAAFAAVQGTGWLTGWRLTFGGEDVGWEGSIATVVEDGELEQVYVALYDITTADERALDDWEGVPIDGCGARSGSGSRPWTATCWPGRTSSMPTRAACQQRPVPGPAG